MLYSGEVVVAMGVNNAGSRELLGLRTGKSETKGIWAEFIYHLKEKDLYGVKLVKSDAKTGAT